MCGFVRASRPNTMEANVLTLYDAKKRSEILSQNSIVLEKVVRETGKLVGVVKVANYAFEKNVFAWYTLDSRKTWKEAKAKWQRSVPEENTDIFQFCLEWPEPTSVKKVEFALCCQQAGQAYWDNNHSKNYVVVHRPSPFDAAGKPVEQGQKNIQSKSDVVQANSTNSNSRESDVPPDVALTPQNHGEKGKKDPVKPPRRGKEQNVVNNEENLSPTNQTTLHVIEEVSTLPDKNGNTLENKNAQSTTTTGPQENNNNVGKQTKGKRSLKKRALHIFGILRIKKKTNTV